MKKNIIHVAVTGGAGQIAYSLLFRIAKGEVFGEDQPIHLSILEIPQAFESLKGVVMELKDCCFPLLERVTISSDPKEAFEAVEYAFLVGAKPRGKGMERKQLLSENGEIFVSQGKALNRVASKNVKVLVVGNPCNTNCLICMHNAPDLLKENFFAMTRLDQNRATTQLAEKAGVLNHEVEGVIIWGNHSSTQVPDFLHAKIQNKPVVEVIKDKDWLENQFFTKVQKRGAEIIQARGKSSAASAAHASIESMKSLFFPTPKDTYFSLACISDQNPYGIEEDLIFSFPCRLENQKIEIVSDFEWNSFLTKKMKETEQELLEEREMVRHLL